MVQPLQTAEPTQQQVHIDVPANKAEFLKQISMLGVDTLQILAEKSKKPGIEKRLQQFKSLI